MAKVRFEHADHESFDEELWDPPDAERSTCWTEEQRKQVDTMKELLDMKQDPE